MYSDNYQKLFGPSNLETMKRNETNERNETKERIEVKVFESKSEFSNETMQFIPESCNDHYKPKDGLFSVTNGKQVKEILGSLNITGLAASRVVEDWNGPACPVQMTFHFGADDFPNKAEFDIQKL